MKLAHFSGELVFLVGGSAGIGFAIAKKLVEAGSQLVIFARNEETLKTVMADLSVFKVSEQQILTYRLMDAGDHYKVDEVMADVIQQYGAPKVLINCAGRAIPDYAENIQIDQFEETLRTNLFSCRNTVHAVLPHMKTNGGLIVNTASLAGLIGVFGYTDYSASKFAVIGYSEALRSELKPYNIRVSVLCPPDTDTLGFHNENKTKPAETHAISQGANLLSADQVAMIFFKELAKNKRLIIPGKAAKFSHLMKRLFPVLVEKVMDMDIKKATNG